MRSQLQEAKQSEAAAAIAGTAPVANDTDDMSVADDENVKVKDAMPARVTLLDGVSTTSGPTPGTSYEGVATLLTEHNAAVFLDDAEELRLGSQVELEVEFGPYHVRLRGVVTQVVLSRKAAQSVHTIEILDFGDDWGEYLQVLYDRVPTLPQRFTHDPGPIRYFWRNLSERIGHTAQVPGRPHGEKSD